MAYGKITAKQKEILDFIKSELMNRGYPPSVRDICQAVNLKSTSSVHSHLENFNQSRRELVNVPLVGTVAAGQPILAVENVESYFPIPTEYLPNKQVFMLKVHGESMINAGILDGDEVIVAQQNTAKNGDMVVALLGDSATVKTFYKENGYIRLQPENTLMDPIIVYGDLTILGKVIGIMRFLK